MTKIMHAIAAIMYDKDDEGYHFLILKKKGAWTGWQFVQGEREDEEWKDAVCREVKEETGLDCEDVMKIDVKADYWFKWEGEIIHKFLHYFLVKVDMKKDITLSEEHSEYRWADFEAAYKELKFNKEQFKKAFELLKEAGK